jgi:hypothetical protein
MFNFWIGSFFCLSPHFISQTDSQLSPLWENALIVLRIPGADTGYF